MSLIIIFRFALVAIACLFIFSSFSKYLKRQKSQTVFKLLANIFIWIGIAVFAIFPKATHEISVNLGFGESLNTFIFIGFVIIFMILFKIINIIERTERNISEIVRKEALSKISEN